MTNKKMTKKEMFTMVMEVVEVSETANKAEMMDFLAHEIELLERKKSSSAKTKSQVENEKIMVSILEELAQSEKPMTVTELMQTESLAGLSNQKLSALLRLLKEDGKVVKTIDKKKSYFALTE
jgi:predicted transcriptional regulator